jgi:hypothetical protein
MNLRLGFLHICSSLTIFVASPNGAQAEIVFNGQWENYSGVLYGPNGWQNGAPTGHPTGNGDWSDFEAFWTPALDNTWMLNTSWARDRIRLEQDPTSPRQGLVARFEVRSGDHREGAYSGERSEMYSMLGRNHKKLPVTVESGHEYYGISVKVSPDWRSPHPESPQKCNCVWGTFMQLHSPNVYASPPALGLMAENDFHLNMDAGDLDKISVNPSTGQPRHTKKDGQSFALSDGDLRRGHWVQFMLDVVWANDSNGSVKLYRRDEKQPGFRQVLNMTGIPTLQWNKLVSTEGTKPGDDSVVHYWRIGFYRSTSPNQTNVLWLGPVVRGTSFDEVAEAAFGSSGPRTLSSP